MKEIRILFLFAIALSLLVAGCGKKEEEAGTSPHETGEIPLEQTYAPPGPTEVAVPEDIKSAWKGIVIELFDNETGEKNPVTIGLGQEVEIEGSGLKIKAVSFLPAFQMDGALITSRSNEPENPAAQIMVFEGEEEIFKGWLFSLYPTTHAFTHQKYSITLLEGVAADKG